MNKYKVWTWRALLVWVPVVLALTLGPVVASIMLAGSAPWHVHLLNAIVPVATMFIVWRRHQLHQRIGDSIDRYLWGGARLVVDVPYMSEAEIEAIEDGLSDAIEDVEDALHVSARVYDSLDTVFVIVRSEVLDPKQRKVGGLTYPSGTILIEYTSDLALLKDRARHEGCHAALNYMGVRESDHHLSYPELFQ